MADSKKQGARYIEVGEADAGQRLDNYLFRQLKGVPKSHVYRTVRTGQVRLNGHRCRAHFKLASGDRVRIPPLRTASRARRPVGFEGPVEILYEDETLVVYDKPSGLAVHGGSGISAGLIERARAQAGPIGAEYQLAHRLDRDTSGIVMVAKRRRMLRELHALFRAGEIRKKYAAIVRGTWEPRHAELAAPLSKWGVRKGERIVDVDDEGKSALTRTRCVRQWDGAAMLEVNLVTGRTHQIRVHLAHGGLPVVGDDKYGDFAHNRSVRSSWGIARLMLHAHEVRFRHPGSGQPMRFTSPLPDEFRLFGDCAGERG